MTRPAAGELAGEHDRLLFGVRRSVRYHRHRERFLDGVHHIATVATAVGASATVVALVADLPDEWTPIRLLAASLTAVASATELTFGPARTARRHEVLAVRFVDLEKDLVRAEPGVNEDVLRELQARRLDIEAGEPPVYRVLDAVCHDELLTALGRDPAHRTNVTRWQRFWRHVADIGAHRLAKHVDLERRAAKPAEAD